jgi:uncharacterized damage-inducible protein DinB
MTGEELGDKVGRPRRYDFTAESQYPSEVIGYSVSVLDELLERVVDQIDDLPPEAFAYRHEAVWFPLGWLPLHLAVSEYNQVRRMAAGIGVSAPEADRELDDRLAIGSIRSSGTVPEELHNAELLIRAMRRARGEITKPICREISDAHVPVSGAEVLSTPQSVLMHLFWHWTYHSGHIGLMRLEWGSDYEWKLAQTPAT